VETTLALTQEHDLRPENIESVQVTTYDYAAETVGSNYPDATTNFLKCQFSLPYVVAVSIADREVSLPQFTSERIVDPKLLDLCRRVRVVGNEEMTRAWPETRPSQVEIRTVDGRKLIRRVDYPLGDKRNPLTEEQFLAKFDLLISFGLGAYRSEGIKAQVEDLDRASHISGLIESLD
jgi:2-methylcitrate dehydratase PrpD